MNSAENSAMRVVEGGELYVRRRPGSRWEVNFFEISEVHPSRDGLFLASRRLDGAISKARPSSLRKKPPRPFGAFWPADLALAGSCTPSCTRDRRGFSTCRPDRPENTEWASEKTIAVFQKHRVARYDSRALAPSTPAAF